MWLSVRQVKVANVINHVEFTNSMSHLGITNSMNRKASQSRQCGVHQCVAISNSCSPQFVILRWLITFVNSTWLITVANVVKLWRVRDTQMTDYVREFHMIDYIGNFDLPCTQSHDFIEFVTLRWHIMFANSTFLITSESYLTCATEFRNKVANIENHSCGVHELNESFEYHELDESCDWV